MRWEDVAAEGATLRGWPLVRRLMHVAACVPEVRIEAAREASDVVRAQTSSVPAYEAALALSGDAVDEAWVEATHARLAQERDRLFGELRMYQNNSITESIRMAHQDLGDHFRHAGEMDAALGHYEQMREFCTTSEHALEMYIRAMQVAWDVQQYATVLAYTDKAESVLATLAERDAAAVALPLPSQTEPWRASLAQGNTGSAAIRALFQSGGMGGAGEAPSPAATAGAADGAPQQRLLARVRALRTLARWAQCDKSAPLPEVVCDATHAAAYDDLISPALLAWYAVLTALRTPPPAQRQRVEALLQDAEFAASIEGDVAPREALAAYRASDFRKCLATLEAHVPRLRLDPVVGPAISVVLEAIRAQLLACYLSAFRRASLQSIAAAFAWEKPAVAARVVAQSAAGTLGARLDWAHQFVEREPRRFQDGVGQHAAEASALRERIALVQQMHQAEYVACLPSMAVRR